jgi:hypothetical protein
MYEDLVTAAQRTSEAAVRESQERVDLAVNRSEEADRKATEATRSIGERWSNRINAMRRRATDRATSTEMNFGHEEGPHPNDHTENDELVSLTESTTPSSVTPGATPGPESDRTPPLGIPQQSPESYGRHAQQTESGHFMAEFAPEPENQQQARFAPPPSRRSAPPRRTRSAADEDDDYSGQSWLEGR